MNCATENQVVLMFVGLSIIQIILWVSLFTLIHKRTAKINEVT